MVTAKYDFVGADDTQLTFTKGTSIRVLAKNDSGWWKGEIAGGDEGLFPSTYAEAQDDQERGLLQVLGFCPLAAWPLHFCLGVVGCVASLQLIARVWKFARSLFHCFICRLTPAVHRH